MSPNEKPEFARVIGGLFESFARNPSERQLEQWWRGLKIRDLEEVRTAVDSLMLSSKTLPTLSHINDFIVNKRTDSKSLPPTKVPKFVPGKTLLMAARRHLEMHGEIKARDYDGDEVVDSLLRNPHLGYSVVEPRSWGGELPEQIREDIRAGTRKGMDSGIGPLAKHLDRKDGNQRDDDTQAPEAHNVRRHVYSRGR